MNDGLHDSNGTSLSLDLAIDAVLNEVMDVRAMERAKERAKALLETSTVQPISQKLQWTAVAGAWCALAGALWCCLYLPRAPSGLNVTFLTNPPGARIVVAPIDPATGDPIKGKRVEAAGVTPVTIRLPGADYLVVAVTDDGDFHEVFRRVPVSLSTPPTAQWPHLTWASVDGKCVLPVITIPIEGRRQKGVVSDDADGHIDVTENHGVPFQMDMAKVTKGRFAKVMGVDISGSSSEDDPQTDVTFDEAVAYAEVKGKRLPTSAEIDLVFSNGGAIVPAEDYDSPFASSLANEAEFTSSFPRRPQLRFLASGSLSKDGSWKPRPMRHESARVHLSAQEKVNGDKYIIAVESFVALRESKRDRLVVPRMMTRHYRIPRGDRSPFVGFRCVRSLRPQLETSNRQGVNR